jgi:protein deglycase
MDKNAVIILADGFEEIEAITPVDILRRADINVTITGLSSLEVKGSHGILIKTDMLLNNFSELYDVLILPGGPGYKNLLASQKVLDMIKYAFVHQRICAAICAAPTIFGRAGILTGKKATCFPGMESGLTGATFVEKDTVVDQNVITSRGAGTAIGFALEIVSCLKNREAAKNTAEKIVYNYKQAAL